MSKEDKVLDLFFSHVDNIDIEVTIEELEKWERSCPHVLVIYLKYNKKNQYEIKDEVLSGLMESCDDRAIMLHLMRYMEFDQLVAMSAELEKRREESRVEQEKGDDQLSVFPLRDSDLSDVAVMKYRTLKQMLRNKLFAEEVDPESFIRGETEGLQYKHLKFWECLVKFFYEPFTISRDLFAGDALYIKERIDSLLAMRNGFSLYQKRKDTTILYLRDLFSFLQLNSHKERRRLVRLEPISSSFGHKIFFKYLNSRCDNRGQHLYELREAIKMFLMRGRRELNRNGRKEALRDIPEYLPLVENVFEEDVLFMPGIADLAINQLLRLESERVYQYLSKLVKNPKVYYFFLKCNKHCYQPSVDGRGAVKLGIMKVVNEAGYQKVRELSGWIGIFMTFWAIFWIKEVFWMFVALAISMTLMTELITVLSDIDKENRNFVTAREVKPEVAKNLIDDEELSDKPKISNKEKVSDSRYFPWL